MTTNPTSSPSPSRSSRPSRSSPASARAPGWSDSQRLTFLRACSAAGLNDAQRYILMHHCGCPSQAEGRPSIKHARNTNTMFAAAMAIAEAQARQRGREIRPPREFASWREAALSSRMQLVNKARCIIAEARDRMPANFDEGLERYIVEHTTAGDDGELVTVAPKSLDEVDGGQAHRVVEALRAFVGRKFAQGGYTPRTFDIPPSVRRREAPRQQGAEAPRASMPSPTSMPRSLDASMPTPGAGHSRAPSSPQSSPPPDGDHQPAA